MAKDQSSDSKLFKPLEKVPSTWPGGFGLYKYSKQAVRPNIAALVGVNALTIPFAAAPDLFFGQDDLGYSVLSLVSGLVSAWLAGATTKIWLGGIAGKKVRFEDAFRTGIDYFWTMFLVGLLVVGAALGSLLLFIIPIFFVLPRLVFAQIFVIDKDMGPVEAFKASWNYSKGHVTKVYSIIGVNIAITALAITIIGIPFAIYFYIMYSAAFVLLYKLIGSTPKKAAPKAA